MWCQLFIATIIAPILRSIQQNGNASKTSYSLARELITKTDGKDFSLELPATVLRNNLSNNNNNIADVTDLQTLFKKDDTVTSVTLTDDKRSIVFHVRRDVFIKETLNQGARLLKTDLAGEGPEKIIVEYGSPNIAKPFHVGHLRSVIIGNFIANLYEYLGHNVVRMNYPGDWGTQFGMVKLGLDLAGYSDEMLQKDSVRLLYEAYVLANKKANEDPLIIEKAKEVFHQLEEKQPDCLKYWQKCRQYTMEELEKTYSRLGVTYDEYEWESSYGKEEVAGVINLLESKGLLKVVEGGGKVVPLSDDHQPVVVKSDGSMLYLSRDLAAAISRQERHRFDRMLYIVDNGQTKHFKTLFDILSRLDLPWASNLVHVKFGRIRGMSTRKGNVIFLKDVLDEIQEEMRKKQQQTATTKVDLSNLEDTTSDILGITSVIVNDLKKKRTSDYDFSWDKALEVSGDSGSKLQYAHCRLWSLNQNSNVSIASECDPSVLMEPEVADLIQEIARFDESLWKSSKELEACIFVRYLFNLSDAINKAFRTLQVKNQDPHIASQRLLLFNVSRNVLYRGMKILGLCPLNRM